MPLAGPIFTRELLTLPRRGRTYVARAAYVGAMLVLMSTAWQVLAGTQMVRSVGDFARFGALVFQILAPLSVTAVTFFAALTTAASVAYEKDRRTFDLLLLTNLTNSELVLGKLTAGLLKVANMTLAAVPVLALTTLMGGVGFRQVIDVTIVAAAALVTAGSLGSTIALWREKTYQTLAVVTIVIVVWIGFWEAARRHALGEDWFGTRPETWAAVAAPWHAMLAAAQPFDDADFALGPIRRSAAAHALFAAAAVVLLNAIAILRVRVWNPTRELLPQGKETAQTEAPHRWSLAAVRSARESVPAASEAVAARGLRRTRTVGNNPILWREVMTWAYGRKVLLIRLAYVLVFAACCWGLRTMAADGSPTPADAAPLVVLPAVVGLLLINLQAVTAVTAERDARALDLLLVTDLTPKEFVFGKLGGVLYNAKEMLLLPPILGALIWNERVIGGEAAIYLAVGWAACALFAAVTGMHVGMHYSESRAALAVSLGTVFFLLVGIAVSMRIMVAFSGSFQAQLQPFIATIVGGGVGLYAALGRRNPSPAIMLASFLLPLATFYGITSYLLDAPLATLLSIAGAYGFATTALVIPAVFEFDVATGRTTGEESG